MTTKTNDGGLAATRDREPLSGWWEQELWFRPVNHDPIYHKIWYPATTSDDQKTRLLERHAASFVVILKGLLTKEQAGMIVQGAMKRKIVHTYKGESATPLAERERGKQ